MFADHTDSVPAVRSHWRFWLLVIGTPLLVLVLSGVIWVLRSNSALESAIAEADRLDPRWRLEEIEADRFTPPKGQNAADTIAKTQKLRRPKWPGAEMVSLLDGLPPERQLNSQQVAALADRLGLVGSAMAEARSLINTPRGRYAITLDPMWGITLLPAQDNREVLTLLRFDVLDKAQVGDADGAIRSCHAAFHAGCSIGDDPRGVLQIARIAVQGQAIRLLDRVLAQGEPSEGVLAALQARLEMEEPAPLLLYALCGDRACGFMFLENIRNGTLPLGSIRTPGTLISFDVENVLYRTPGYVAAQEAIFLHHMNDAIEIAKLPPEHWAEWFATQDAKIKQTDLAGMLASAGAKIARTCQRNHANLRCAIIAVAAERFRHSQGRWPMAPGDLVNAGLLKAVPADPYAAGLSIKFARPGDGLVVYTTGEDGKDDGGKLDADAKKAGTDFGFRLWDVAARRQPPLPPKTDTP